MNHYNTTNKLGGESMDREDIVNDDKTDVYDENGDNNNNDSNSTKTTPLKKKKARKPTKKIRVEYAEDDYKMVIETYTPKPRGYTRMNISRITQSYWRVNVWAKQDADKPKSLWNPQRIVASYFVRLEVSNDGTLQYTDVSTGHDL